MIVPLYIHANKLSIFLFSYCIHFAQVVRCTTYGIGNAKTPADFYSLQVFLLHILYVVTFMSTHTICPEFKLNFKLAYQSLHIIREHK